ncbi:hypothetical protein OAG51_00520 [Pirellulaceae bacterium]|nr:hypothetical protein [Pirellulaceae bacterium]
MSRTVVIDHLIAWSIWGEGTLKSHGDGVRFQPPDQLGYFSLP